MGRGNAVAEGPAPKGATSTAVLAAAWTTEKKMGQPICPTHGLMQKAPPGTPEQKWCGEWWRCERCTNSVLIPSETLKASHAHKMNPTGMAEPFDQACEECGSFGTLTANAEVSRPGERSSHGSA